MTTITNDELTVDVPLTKHINDYCQVDLFIEKDVLGIVELNFEDSKNVPGFKEVKEVFFFTIDIVRDGSKVTYKTVNKRNEEISATSVLDLLAFIYV